MEDDVFLYSLNLLSFLPLSLNSSILVLYWGKGPFQLVLKENVQETKFLPNTHSRCSWISSILIPCYPPMNGSPLPLSQFLHLKKGNRTKKEGDRKDSLVVPSSCGMFFTYGRMEEKERVTLCTIMMYSYISKKFWVTCKIIL